MDGNNSVQPDDEVAPTSLNVHSQPDLLDQLQAPYQPLSASTAPFFRPVTTDDLNTVYQLESSSYPPDEAASLEKLQYRIDNAANLFLICVLPCYGQHDHIVGFVNGTCTSGTKLEHSTMSNHDPEGQLLCIHSVCVDAAHRRKGFALKMLRAYLPYVKATTPQLTAVHLLCKQDLVGLYEKAGFKLLGPSDVVHGQDQWLEMAYTYDY